MTTNLELHMKRGDSAPAFRAQCLDSAPNGTVTVVDLTLATEARLIMRCPDETIFNEVLTIEVPNTTGWVSRPWDSTDVDQIGDYAFEVQITWSSGKIQTFPGDQYGLLSVIDDLD